MCPHLFYCDFMSLRGEKFDSKLEILEILIHIPYFEVFLKVWIFQWMDVEVEVEVEEVVEVIDEDDEEEWSPNLAKLLAKRSRLSQNLARQRRNHGKTRF